MRSFYTSGCARKDNLDRGRPDGGGVLQMYIMERKEESRKVRVME